MTHPVKGNMAEHDGNTSLLSVELSGLFHESIIPKLWKVATERIENNEAPDHYPEWVPEDGKTPGVFNTKEVVFWTCGFFPGSLYCILERCIKYPKSLSLQGIDRAVFHEELLKLCRIWSGPLHRMALRTNTHDLGFITQPALRQDWELTGNLESKASLITAANNLASRYSDKLKAVRSWDKQINKRFNTTDKESNFLVIVDSMCNMDLLFYVGHHTSNQRLIEIATNHAHFVRRNLVRDDFSTWHVTNVNPHDGSIMSKHTHQGYNDDSCWSRGQAWAILGFTQTYIWTKDPIFLETAIRVSEHFLDRLRGAKHAYPFVPLWDFDAPVDSTRESPLRDSSAGMAAAYGLLLLHQTIVSERVSSSISSSSSPSTTTTSSFLDDALRIARDTIAMCQTTEPARLKPAAARGPATGSPIEAHGVTFDAILRHATPNYHEFAAEQYYDCGLVYADYFFLLFGNTLLRLGLI